MQMLPCADYFAIAILFPLKIVIICCLIVYYNILTKMLAHLFYMHIFRYS